MATASSLGVWLDETRVAELEQSRGPRIRLRYTKEAFSAAMDAMSPEHL